MLSRSEARNRLADAARRHGLDVDPDTLMGVILTAFAPRATMTASERQFMLDSEITGHFRPGRPVSGSQVPARQGGGDGGGRSTRAERG